MNIKNQIDQSTKIRAKMFNPLIKIAAVCFDTNCEVQISYKCDINLQEHDECKNRKNRSPNVISLIERENYSSKSDYNLVMT